MKLRIEYKDRIFVNKSQFKIVQAVMNTKHEVLHLFQNNLSFKN